MRCLSVLSVLVLTCDAFKYLVYIPVFGKSHITFMGKIVDVLVDGGHEVHVIAPVIESYLGGYGSTKAHKVFHVPPNEAAQRFENTTGSEFASNLWRKSDMITMLKEAEKFVDAWLGECNATLHHPGLLDELRKENYDAAISEAMDMCGFGIFEHIGLKSVAAALSVGHMEWSFLLAGVPSMFSYVPGVMMSTSEQMTFLERVTNVFPIIGRPMMHSMILVPYEKLFRATLSSDFPDLESLMRKTSLVILNAEPLIDFPHLTSHKVIDVGGISVSSGHKPLDKKWSDILDKRPKNVLISFGTVAKSYLMPQEYKDNIRATVRKFPNITFIWKYEKPEDGMSEGIDNLVETTFAPQNDLLYDPRLSLFLTHCGQGSTSESTTAGIPLIVIPILGDQFRNSAVIRRIGSGVVLKREDLGNSDVLESALKEVLSNPEYARKARITGEMIRNRPFSPKDLFLRNMEFLAQFGPLTKQFEHYAHNLNFFQYYLIDVFAFIAFSVLGILAIVFFSLTFVIRHFPIVWKLKAE